MRKFGASIVLLLFAVSTYAAVIQRGPNPGVFAQAVVAAADTTPPAAITNLSSLAASSSSINLTWTSPGDDGASGALTGTFRVFYSSVAADVTSVTATSSAAGTLSRTDISTTAATPGATQSTTINSLLASTAYFFRAFSADEVTNWSAVSNASTATTTSATTSDITWYWNADSATSGISPQKGLGTITIGASWVSTTPAIVGTASIYNSNTGNTGGRITVSSTSWDFSAGRLGFYAILKEATGAATDGDPFWVNGDTGTVATSKMHLQVNASGTWLFDYSNATQLSVGTLLSQNTTAYVEIAWDYATTTLGAACKVYKDGSLVGTCAGTPNAGVPAGGTIRFGGQDSNATAMIMDQIIFSTNPLRDLNAVKDTTSF